MEIKSSTARDSLGKVGASIEENLKNLHAEQKLAVQLFYRISEGLDAGSLPPALCV
jgi:hypothetical protein